MIPYLSFAFYIIYLIFILKAMNNIERLNQHYNNPNLRQFHVKCLNANYIKLIAFYAVNIGGAILPFAVDTAGISPIIFPFIPSSFWLFFTVIILFILGFILGIICSSIEMKAWDNIGLFFAQNKEIFPLKVWNDSLEAADKLKKGVKLWALGFLAVTVLIGWIYQIIGYFKLATFNKWGTSKEIQATLQVQPSVSPPQESISPTNYCPFCGEPITKEAKFCGNCGSTLSKD